MSLELRYDQTMMNTFGNPQLSLSHGDGVKVWDLDGREYLDLLAGIAVNTLGHNHPVLVKAISEQAQRFLHVSNFFATEPQVALAEALQDCLNEEGYVGSSARFFFSNSGTEANETAIKIARLHKPGGRILAFTNGFHGRTLGSLSLTHKESIRAPFEPLPGNVTFVEPTREALDEAFSEDVAAIFVEAIQGEAGVAPIPADVLIRARDLSSRFNALMVVDEVQTGAGRTGRWFAHSKDVKADVITLAKGLGGGVPIGVTIATQRSSRILGPGHHGSTFGGNPLAATAALTVIDQVRPLLPHVLETGAWLKNQLTELGYDVRGEGLLLGIDVDDARAMTQRLREDGVIVNAPNPTTLRIAPPLIITRDDLELFITLMANYKENS